MILDYIDIARGYMYCGDKKPLDINLGVLRAFYGNAYTTKELRRLIAVMDKINEGAKKDG